MWFQITYWMPRRRAIAKSLPYCVLREQPAEHPVDLLAVGRRPRADAPVERATLLVLGPSARGAGPDDAEAAGARERLEQPGGEVRDTGLGGGGAGGLRLVGRERLDRAGVAGAGRLDRPGLGAGRGGDQPGGEGGGQDDQGEQQPGRSTGAAARPGVRLGHGKNSDEVWFTTGTGSGMTSALSAPTRPAGASPGTIDVRAPAGPPVRRTAPRRTAGRARDGSEAPRHAVVPPSGTPPVTPVGALTCGDAPAGPVRPRGREISRTDGPGLLAHVVVPGITCHYIL